jgi:hypothetical protein
MADWTTDPIGPLEGAPGKIDPPAPDQVKPTDPGWADFVKQESEKTGLKVTPECQVTLDISATGRTEDRPIDGDYPTGYTADGNWGWTEDREYETQAPEPYQDFTRWVRHYPALRWQRCKEYRAQVIVRCGSHFVAPPPYRFWVKDGAPFAGSADDYFWTRTSGLEKGEDGHEYKWRTTGKKTPPYWQYPEPPSGRDLSHPHTTPPEWLVHPRDWPVDWKPDFKPRLKYEFEPGTRPVDPFGKGFKWFHFRDF